MRFVLAVVIPITAALLQGTVAPLLGAEGARPSLPLLVAATWSVAAGAREAVWWAFLGGTVVDLISGGPLGASALAALPPVTAIGLRDASASRPTSVVAGAVLVGLAALGASLLYIAILQIAGEPVGNAPLAASRALATAIFTGILAIALYPLARIVRRVTEKQGALGVW